MELLGGLGMFMLGMTMMSSGLKLAAGPALERILASATKTRLRGLGAGVLITTLVQSSSAVTIATIGFANAGLLSLTAAIWVLFGASIGTTSTGWIVALAGLKFSISAAALPLIAFGVIVQIVRQGHRSGYLGEAVAGFGLLFYGVVLLQSGFESVSHGWEIPQGEGWGVAALQAVIGFVMTVIVQSSAASIVIAISAAQAGMIDIGGAAAVVIGANLGTKVTAVLAMVGGTPNAKRVATAHLIFHVIAAVVGFILLPALLWVNELLRGWFGLAESAATSLALFNTLFNVFSLLLLWPFVDWLSNRLKNWYVPAGERGEAKPMYLDKNTLPVPSLAASALALEIGRIVSLASSYLSCTTHDATEASARRRDIRTLLKASQIFIDEMGRGTMDEETGDRLAMLLRVRRYLENVLDLVQEALRAPTSVLTSETMLHFYPDFVTALDALVQSFLDEQEGHDLRALSSGFEQSYQALKKALLMAGATGQCRVEDMEVALHRISSQRRAVRQLLKAQRWMSVLEKELPVADEEADEQDETA